MKEKIADKDWNFTPLANEYFYRGGKTGVLLLHGFEDLCAGELVPRRRDDDGVLVVLTQQGHGGGQLLLGDGAGAAENDGGGGLDLVRVEFTEILQIDLALRGICHGDEAAERDALVRNALHSTDDVAELADT